MTDQPERADARRNRRRILDAAKALILEIGGEPSRDAVARAAGVGIATLYRHFPDQQSLLRAVTLDVLDQTIASGEAALAEDGRDVLRRYLHDAIDNGLGVVNIVHPLLDNSDWPEQTKAAHDMLARLVAVARQHRTISEGVTAVDITHAAIRFSRPLAIGLDAATERKIAHRQLDAYLDGLGCSASS